MKKGIQSFLALSDHATIPRPLDIHHCGNSPNLVFLGLYEGFIYHSNHPKPAGQRKDVIKRKQYLELMVDAFTIPQMSDVTVLFLEIL